MVYRFNVSFLGGDAMGLMIFGALIVLAGLCLTLDARRLVKKYLNFGEENVAVLGMKIFGFAMILIGGLIMLAVNFGANFGDVH